MMRANGRCRSCLAPIRWGTNVSTGKAMPLNPSPDPNGNIWIVKLEQNNLIFDVAATPDGVPSSEPLRYTSHFATCPQAAEHRRK